MKKYLLSLYICTALVFAQPWVANDAIFNPSGVPSLTFSAPRFADLDSDNDFDLILGGSNVGLIFLENTGTKSLPKFTQTGFVEHDINYLEAEVAAIADINGDGLPDMITGGFMGLTCFYNTGDSTSPVFERDTLLLSGLECGHNPVPTLADVNDDNLVDLMIGLSENGSIKYYINTGTSTSPVFTETYAISPGIDVGLYAYPYLCDPDKDDDFDIIIGRDGLGIYFYRNDGSPQAPAWAQYSVLSNGLATTQYFTTPCMVDLNNNGLDDVVYGDYTGPLNYYRNNGSATAPVWIQDKSLFGGVIDVGGASNPCLYDFDGDGDLDLLSGYNMGGLRYYRNIGSQHAPAWENDNSYFNSIDLSIYSTVTIGDINNDGLPDLLMGDAGSSLNLYENNGSGFTLNSTHFGSVGIGWWLDPQFVDIDGDNDLDVTIANDAREIYLYRNLGSVLSPVFELDTAYYSSITGYSNSSPAVGDLDADGDFDLLIGGISGYLKYFCNIGSNATPVWQDSSTLFSGVEVDQNATPAFGDLDGDGDLDLVLGDYDGTLHYYENTAEPSAIDEQMQAIPKHPLIVSTYPNPFNSQVNFAIELSATGNLEIVFYNLRGQSVYEVWQFCSSTGQHTISLAFPTDVASGLYLYRISLADGSEMPSLNGKILYLK